MSKTMEKGTENAIFLDGRDYTAADLYRLIGLLVGNGVYMNELAPTATNEDMSITHGAGHAWISGVAYWNTTPFVLDIATADGSLNRYDSLMLRLNLSINEVYAVIVQGAYATNPTPPACVRNAETFDLKLCNIYVPAGCTKITQDNITDTRLDSSVCGVPVFPVEHLDMSSFYRQIATDLSNFQQKNEADFTAWVEEQQDNNLAMLAAMVEVVRNTSDESQAKILSLLEQINNLINEDTVGVLIQEINDKLPKSGGDVTGEIRMNGNPVSGLNAPTEDTQAANKGYVDAAIQRAQKCADQAQETANLALEAVDAAKAEAGAYTDESVRKAAPRNLLDNSDFRNPVNSNGQTIYTTADVDTIDRWMMYTGSVMTVTVADGCLLLDNSSGTKAYNLFHRFDETMSRHLGGKVVTIAVCDNNDVVTVASGTLTAADVSSNTSQFVTASADDKYYINVYKRSATQCFEMRINLRAGQSYGFQWAAMYEGTYTAETLPEYQPKGYMVEALNCGALHVTTTATITTTWSGSSAPYTQVISVAGISQSDTPHITPVYSTTNATAIAQKEAWACVSKAVTAAGKITFTCFEDKPTTAIPIQIEVNR